MLPLQTLNNTQWYQVNAVLAGIVYLLMAVKFPEVHGDFSTGLASKFVIHISKGRKEVFP